MIQCIIPTKWRRKDDCLQSQETGIFLLFFGCGTVVCCVAFAADGGSALATLSGSSHAGRPGISDSLPLQPLPEVRTCGLRRDGQGNTMQHLPQPDRQNHHLQALIFQGISLALYCDPVFTGADSHQIPENTAEIPRAGETDGTGYGQNF